MKLVAPAKSYALERNNNTLFASVNYSATSLGRLRDTVLVNVLTIINTTITGIMTELADYGVVAADLTAFESTVDAYNALLSAPRANTAARANATRSISATLSKMNNVLKRMDGLAETKKDSHTDFYNTYKSTRTIVDYKGGGAREMAPGETLR